MKRKEEEFIMGAALFIAAIFLLCKGLNWVANLPEEHYKNTLTPEQRSDYVFKKNLNKYKK